jgi:hypothetical protein
VSSDVLLDFTTVADLERWLGVAEQSYNRLLIG